MRRRPHRRVAAQSAPTANRAVDPQSRNECVLGTVVGISLEIAAQFTEYTNYARIEDPENLARKEEVCSVSQPNQRESVHAPGIKVVGVCELR